MNTKKLYLAVFMTLFLLFSISILILKYLDDDIKITYEPYTVSQGDTLLSISIECSLKQDIRETIYQIRKVNELKSAIIYPGQVLYIPCIREDGLNE